MSKSTAFMGSKEAGLQLCSLLCELLPRGTLKAIICPNDSQDSRSVFPLFLDIAQKNNIPIHITNSREETASLIDKYNVQISFVHGWYQIIPIDGSCEFYGFHYSLLPKYRGNAPLVWQIINGESEVGVSFFRFNEFMDEGEIVSQEKVKLECNEDIGDALRKTNALAIELARKYIPHIISNEIALFPQSKDQPSYCGMRIKDDGRVDWSWSAKRVHDFIRAQASPYPGAFSFTENGGKVIFWKSSLEPRVFYGVPGSVVAVMENAVTVACGSGAIRLHIIEEETGGKRNASEVFKSLKSRLV